MWQWFGRGIPADSRALVWQKHLLSVMIVIPKKLLLENEAN
jgi:hypothetical protein